MPAFKGFDEAVVFDVETTGLSASHDRIVSIAMIRAGFAHLRDQADGSDAQSVCRLVNPERPIPKRASAVHGILDRHVRCEPSFAELAEELREFIGDRPLIAHNATFDKGFIEAEFRRAGVRPLQGNRFLCTMKRYREFNHGISFGSTLEDAARALSLSGRRGRVHEADEDAMMALRIAQVFYMMDNGIEIPGGRPKPPPRGLRSSSRIPVSARRPR